MTLSLSQIPQYPIPNRETRVEFTATGNANFVRVWVTDAPIGSELRNRLNATDATRTEVHSGDTSSTPKKGTPWLFQPEKGGKYLFRAQEYVKGNVDFAGGYKGDPDGFPQETKQGSEQSIEIIVGQKLSMRVGTQADPGTLELWVWDSTIRATNVEQHGEITPRIVVGELANRPRTAALSSNVVSALAALVDSTTTDALGDLQTVAENMHLRINQHFTNVAVHPTSDTVNKITPAYNPPSDPKGLRKSINEILRRLRLHMESDDQTVDTPGPGSGAWHRISGDDTADFENALLTETVGDQESAVIALADIFRSYEAHRVDTEYHLGPDGLFPLAALPPLLNLHRRFLQALAAISPTAAPTDNPGITPLVHGAGMKEI